MEKERQIVGLDSLEGLEEVPEELQERNGYPFVQWVNRPDSLMPRQQRGGFAAPVDQGVALAGEYAEILHPDGSSTPVIYTDSLTFAPVAKRFAWVLDGTLVRQYAEGARGKLQVLAWVRADEGVIGPVMLTFRGLAGKAMNAVLKEHAKEVKSAAPNAQSWFFWATARAGKPRLAGSKQKSVVTPVEYDNTAPLEFIGRDVYNLIVSMAEEVSEWRNAWKDTPAPNGDGEISESEEGED